MVATAGWATESSGARTREGGGPFLSEEKVGLGVGRAGVGAWSHPTA